MNENMKSERKNTEKWFKHLCVFMAAIIFHSICNRLNMMPSVNENARAFILAQRRSCEATKERMRKNE